ncbi:MAG: hypothetical protein ACJ0NN_02510 [Thermodesulfobacteriota bacterium]|jgi:hypothetical protein|nr:hypothetical protein [Candidatus Dadabacteria bacterium]|tara:strand:+ start:2373 stop:2711 length:339 start_codon:yes stop_codon:yes gene_type:complete
MRFLILLAFIGFNLSVPLLIDNKNLMNPNNTSSTINHKNMEHEHSSHDHAKTKTPCEDSSESSCTDHECCFMFVAKSHENNSLKETITMQKFLDNSKILSHKLSDIFRPPII